MTVSELSSEKLRLWRDGGNKMRGEREERRNKGHDE